jgi:hypothetical protein
MPEGFVLEVVGTASAKTAQSVDRSFSGGRSGEMCEMLFVTA